MTVITLTYGHDDIFVYRCRKYQPLIVIGMLTDEVHPTWGSHQQRSVAMELQVFFMYCILQGCRRCYAHITSVKMSAKSTIKNRGLQKLGKNPNYRAQGVRHALYN